MGLGKAYAAVGLTVWMACVLFKPSPTLKLTHGFLVMCMNHPPKPHHIQHLISLLRLLNANPSEKAAARPTKNAAMVWNATMAYVSPFSSIVSPHTYLRPPSQTCREPVGFLCFRPGPHLSPRYIYRNYNVRARETVAVTEMGNVAMA